MLSFLLSFLLYRYNFIILFQYIIHFKFYCRIHVRFLIVFVKIEWNKHLNINFKFKKKNCELLYELVCHTLSNSISDVTFFFIFHDLVKPISHLIRLDVKVKRLVTALYAPKLICYWWKKVQMSLGRAVCYTKVSTPRCQDLFKPFPHPVRAWRR